MRKVFLLSVSIRQLKDPDQKTVKQLLTVIEYDLFLYNWLIFSQGIGTIRLRFRKYKLLEEVSAIVMRHWRKWLR